MSCRFKGHTLELLYAREIYTRGETLGTRLTCTHNYYVYVYIPASDGWGRRAGTVEGVLSAQWKVTVARLHQLTHTHMCNECTVQLLTLCTAASGCVWHIQRNGGENECIVYVCLYDRCVGVQRHRHGYIFHVPQ